ncbi:MAG: 2'-5' RNA ligase family protein [Bacteroidetes bacterium]|nr:MAG: 2'-5' RNA ligase family protein [Bacteroidota bacterium]
MAKRPPLYFIALLPPEEISQEVTAFKQILSDRWGARHAFNSPPHITLQPPFPWPDQQLTDLIRVLEKFAQQHSSVPVLLQNFGAFPPRVLFVQPLKSPQLEQLFQALIKDLEHELGLSDPRNHQRPYHPHMTIAHRDLRESDFPEAWRFFKQQRYERYFDASELGLLKHINGKWEIVRTFPFR